MGRKLELGMFIIRVATAHILLKLPLHHVRRWLGKAYQNAETTVPPDYNCEQEKTIVPNRIDP